MLRILRLLVLWRAARLVAPLALCCLLIALAAYRPSSLSRAGATRSLDAAAREVRRLLAPEIARARRALTAALTSGRPR
jgi:hypothetical protein